MPHIPPAGYEAKFENFIKLCMTAKAKGASEVIVTTPGVIGDTYDEVIESLSRLADAGLSLHIVTR
jgi:dihydrodipicolinate synthase/N-acetylneuraminate lyase